MIFKFNQARQWRGKEEKLERRKSKEEYYLGIAEEVAARSACFRRKIGALILRDDQIISTGYVGAPRKTKDSLEHGYCLRDKLGIPHGHRYELCRSVHAEANAIINAARAGVSLLDGDIYIWGCVTESGALVDAFPCFICKKMIINAGLVRVICSTKEGGFTVFHVKDWVRDWQRKDIVDDSEQYGEPFELTPPPESKEETRESACGISDSDFPEEDDNDGDDDVPF